MNLYAHPRSLKRLGRNLFIQCPLYESQHFFKPIYIHQELFHTLFGENLPWDKQADVIKQLFSVTLNKDHSNGKQCGWAFVDKQQEDPYQLSLSGNQGSGRAYYTGHCFNIKGEKTPLATSFNPIYSDGILKISDGIWSSLIGNSLEKELNVMPSLVLAVLLKDDESRCLIVRTDENGALDRITHLLHQPVPLTAKQLKQATQQISRLEAEKFIHRILHGSWSAGNTSLNGHLIDYDTVCAVKGRQPQYSVTPNYPDNYFGFEYLGQLKVLQILIDHPIINSEQVSQSILDKEFQNHYKQYIEEGLIYLMGFEDYSKLAKTCSTELKHLSHLFYELSLYTYYRSPQNFNTNHPASLFFHLFDFSIFFRVYPLLKFSQTFVPSQALYILMHSPGQQDMLAYESEQEEYALPLEVKKRIVPYCIPFGHKCSQELEQKALDFLILYDQLFDSLIMDTQQDKYNIAARAYVINEDRFYLFPVFSLEALILEQIQKKTEPQMIHRLIETLIKANQRLPILSSSNCYVSDYRLFGQGFSYTCLNTNGTYYVAFNLYQDQIDWDPSQEVTWQIEVLNELMPATSKWTPDRLIIESIAMPMEELMLHPYRENTFLTSLYSLYKNQEKINLNDLFYSNAKQGYYL